MSEIQLENIDCMLGMKRYPDKWFELAIVDPPYGIGEDGGKFRDRLGGNHRVLDKKSWDKEKPPKIYWHELFRVSYNQIVWGGHYFTNNLPMSRGWIYWDKLMGGDFADGDLAWSSFDCVLRKFTFCNKHIGAIHPTQKPVKLYEWLLKNYAKKGDKILDTHLGSGSIAIACYNLDFSLVGFEIDADYYKAACNRLEQHKKQRRLFDGQR